ncbi:hypothetical protein Y032_0061g3213 [Ancylostoma ceylanicum]|uniref:SCP domain-containing protein n=1 Tax=Ancylostoma ceylanicum TaxID=53326 RepID=A0A016U1N7_9BILA|nr:hypothetical protein Y032_0061g3213 [Ancylostoma ceylanicum]
MHETTALFQTFTKYNCELEAFAFSYAANCFLNSSDPENRLDTGENVAAVRNATTFGEALEQAANAWWETLKSLRKAFANDLLVRFYRPDHPLQRFMQMAWADTQNIGCAVVKCGGIFNVVCRYLPK